MFIIGSQPHLILDCGRLLRKDPKDDQELKKVKKNGMSESNMGFEKTQVMPVLSSLWRDREKFYIKSRT